MIKLSIVMPVYNEEKTILEILKRVEQVVLLNIEKEIIIIDNGSNDNTCNHLKTLDANKYKIIYQKENLGKGAALREGFQAVTGDLVLIQDADLEYSPEEYPKLIEPILNNGVHVVYGSRILASHETNHFFYYYGNRLVTFLTNMLYGSSLTDMETGYKVFRREVLAELDLKANNFSIEPEITAKILRRYKIFEVPISYVGRSFEDGKKISWKDGLHALYTLLKYKVIE